MEALPKAVPKDVGPIGSPQGSEPHLRFPQDLSTDLSTAIQRYRKGVMWIIVTLSTAACG